MIMARAWLVLLIACGCIVPKHTHTKKTIAHVVEPTPEALPTVLVVNVDAATVHVTALRVCRGHAHDLVEDTLHVTADVIGGSTMAQRPGDPEPDRENSEGTAFIAAITGLITAVDIVARDGKVTVHRERRPDEETACPMALRQLVVEVGLPSGLVVTGRTDDTGTVELTIPETEPAAGEVTVRATGITPRTAAYHRLATGSP
jgi:hypothetical protein